MKRKTKITIGGIVAAVILQGGLILSQALINSTPTPGIDTVLTVGNTTTKALQVGALTVTGSCTGCGGGGGSDLATTLGLGNSAGAYDIDLNGNGLLNVSSITGSSTNSITFSSSPTGSLWTNNSNAYFQANDTNGAVVLTSMDNPFLGPMAGIFLYETATGTMPVMMLYGEQTGKTTYLKLGDDIVAKYTGSLSLVGVNGVDYHTASIEPSSSMAHSISLVLPSTDGTLATTSDLSNYVSKSVDNTLSGSLTVNNDITATGTIRTNIGFNYNGSAGIDFTQTICCTYDGSFACTATGTVTFSKGILTAETCP